MKQERKLTTFFVYKEEYLHMPKIISMVVLGVPCGIQAIKLYSGSFSTSIGIHWEAKKSSFVLDTGNSRSVKIRKCFNNLSISSQLGTSIVAN